MNEQKQDAATPEASVASQRAAQQQAAYPLHIGQQPLNSPEDLRAIHEAISEGKNPLEATDVPRWEDQVGVSRIINRRVLELEPLPTPAQVLSSLPLSQQAENLVAYSRDEIRACLYGQDDRLMVIVGPCSVHDPKAALDYAHRLSALKDELDDQLLIVMRVYFEKPRTTIGWKGLINDPDIDGSHQIRKGLLLARRVLLSVLDTGLAAATEFLEPTSPQYIADAISWGAIGARNTESQIHRQLASGLSMPVGFKTPRTDPSRRRSMGAMRPPNSTRFLVSTIWDARALSKRSAIPTAMWCCAARATGRITMRNPSHRRWRTSARCCPLIPRRRMG